MNDIYPCYGLASGDKLQQGDVLISCPLIRPTATNEFQRHWADVVVLSQSCDLSNDKLEIGQPWCMPNGLGGYFVTLAVCSGVSIRISPIYVS